MSRRPAVISPGESPTFDTTRAACRGYDQEIFFPAVGGVDRGERAKAICRSCPVLVGCRDWALRQPWRRLQGIWGATTGLDRRRAAAVRTDAQRHADPLRATQEG